mmetsp:Transcript_6220/g.7659  ORF Transcript_6220/g.7659 Transcript_6220/m.7659 type:complete len:99 (+) Transcript_6220:237-533(+)
MRDYKRKTRKNFKLREILKKFSKSCWASQFSDAQNNINYRIMTRTHGHKNKRSSHRNRQYDVQSRRKLNHACRTKMRSILSTLGPDTQPPIREKYERF